MAGPVDTNSYLNFGGDPVPPAGKLFTGYGPGQQAATPMEQLVSGGRAGTSYNPFTPQFDTSANLAKEFYSWTPDQLNQFRAQMSLINSSYMTAPVYDPNGAVTGTNSLQAAWMGLVQAAQDSTAAGKSMSPWDILSSDVSAMGARGKAGQSITKNYDTVIQTSKVDAQAIFFQAAQQLLGRAPTDSEMASFGGTLNALERANPVHHEEEIMYTPQGIPIPLEKASSGGVSDQAKQMLALQQAKANPEYGAYQASTTYFGALQDLLKGGNV